MVFPIVGFLYIILFFQYFSVFLREKKDTTLTKVNSRSFLEQHVMKQHMRLIGMVLIKQLMPMFHGGGCCSYVFYVVCNSPAKAYACNCPTSLSV